MEKKISDIGEVLRSAGVARFHYLRGEATYIEGDGEYKLIATAFFPATEEFPTVLDRSRVTERNQPHVNATDSLYAVWNAAHVMACIGGLRGRNLRGKITVDLGNKALMPDTPYRLETVGVDRHEVETKGEKYNVGTLEARFYNDAGDSLPRIKAQWTTKPLNPSGLR